MKRLLFTLLPLLAPSMAFAQATAEKPLIYRIIDSGFFVALIIAIYLFAVYAGIKTRRMLGQGALYNMLYWVNWGLLFGAAFQSYIFIFDYKHVGGFSPASVSVGWHVFFVVTIFFILVGMRKVLK